MMIKSLFYALFAAFALYAAPHVARQAAQTLCGESGPWADYPHSGFCPDSPVCVGR